LLLASACGKSAAPDSQPATPAAAPNTPPKPVTLNYYTNLSKNDMEFETSIIQKKFPHITINPMFYSAQLKIQDLATTGSIPDLVNYTIGSLWDFRDANLLADLQPFVKKFNLDMSRFLPNVMDSVQAYSEKGEMLFIPYTLSTNVLYYNKNIFNKFGVPFPKDGITWTDVNELAKKLTREDGGVKYKGFQFQLQNLTWKNQLMLPLVDPATNKTIINNAGWRQWLETMGAPLLIKGNEVGGSFDKAMDVAMYSGPNLLSNLEEPMKNGLDWDVIALPSFPGSTTVGTQMISPFYGIPPKGSNMDQAFEVIAYMLSEEVQTLKSRKGKVPIINSDTAAKQYGKDIPGIEGKNLEAFFKDKVGKPFKTTKYDDIAKTVIYTELLPGYYKGGSDLNTLFRTAEENINKKIEEKLR
jgi:multiple sugar transport system substrate-binding protein